MNKRRWIFVSAVCAIAIAIGGLAAWNVSHSDKVAKIGKYTMTEAQFKEYWMLSSLQYGAAENTMERAAQQYARSRIATEEIAGTEYDVPATKRDDMTALETENFKRDYEHNITLCHQYGMNRDEFIHAIVTMKMNTLIAGQHFSKVTAEYMEQMSDADREKTDSAEELTAIYERYMADKIDAMTFVPLNHQILQAIVNRNPSDRGDILEKLRTIEPDWTEEDVYILLGPPDRYGTRSVVAEVMYAVDDTTEAVVAFWSEGTQVYLINTVTRETAALSK